MNVPLAQLRRAPELDQSKFLQGLTNKQEAYCLARIGGASKSEAYRAAYDVAGMVDASIYRAAWDVERNVLVTKRLLELKTERDAQETLAPRVDKDFIINGISAIASGPEVKDSTRLAAFIALGKMAGIDLFREIHVTEKRTRTQAEIDSELAERFAMLAKTINGSVNSVSTNSEQSPALTADQAKPIDAAPPLASVLAKLQAEGKPARDRRRKPRG